MGKQVHFSKEQTVINKLNWWLCVPGLKCLTHEHSELSIHPEYP